MPFVAILILNAWLLLLPVALALFVAGLTRRRTAEWAVGLVLLVVASPMLYICVWVWPPDFLQKPGPTRTAFPINGGQVVFVSEPGVDFYDLDLDVIEPDGSVTRLPVDADGDKSWFPRLVREDEESLVVTGLGVTDWTPRIDRRSGRIMTMLVGESEPFLFLIDPALPPQKPVPSATAGPASAAGTSPASGNTTRSGPSATEPGPDSPGGR